MRYLKSLIPFQEETIGSHRIRRVLSLALVVGLLQTFSFTYQVVQAPAAKAATTYAPAGATTLTIPTGVSSISFTIYGGGGGYGGLDCGQGCTEKTPGARGKVTGTFTVVAGDVIGIFPGYAGSAGVGSTNGGGGEGGTDTYPDGNYNGGKGGNAGGSGSSGGGGGGGAASLITKNSAVWAVAGGSAGAGGAANFAGSGQNGNDANTLSTATTNGGEGTQTKYSDDAVIGNDNNGFLGQSCSNTTNDGGGGGGGGGGVNGGAGGNLTNAGSGECSGLGGYRGGNFLNAAITNTTTDIFSASNTSNGSIEITMQLSTPSGVTATQTPDTPGSITVTWPAVAVASGFRVNLHASNSSSPRLEFKNVGSGIYSTTFTSSDYADLAYGTTYFVSIIAIGNSGSPYVDSSESARTSVILTSSSASSSDTDTAISFSGSSNQTASGPTATNLIRETFTASAWVYPTSYGCKGGSPETNDGDCQILGKGTNFRLVIGSSSGANEGKVGYFWNDFINPYVTYSAYKLSLNEWHHVAFSREGSGSNQAKIYIDGNLVFQTTQSNSVLGDSFPFSVGAQNLSSSSQSPSSSNIWSKFIGQIDEVKVSNRARTQAEIQFDMQNYNNSDSSFSLYYDFNENSGTTVFNRISNSLVSSSLTISGGGTFDSSKIFNVDTTTASAYTIIKFFRTILVSSKGWRTPSNINSIRYLVVGGGGGGGGGYNGGGGGAGGFRETNTAISPNTVYNIEVGAGGNGAFTTLGPTSGGGSTIRNNSNALDSITANGGGKGATEQQATGGPSALVTPNGSPGTGGSGGGGSHGATFSGVSGATGNSGGYSPAEGFAGGNGSSGSGYYVGGGGGGATSAGTNAGASTTGLPGNGGAGKTTYITGSALSLAGGGAGSGRFVPSATVVKHGTATDGGGSGACAAVPCATNTDTGTAGTKNTGGGGGAGASELGTALGGSGGSGFIAIRYITNKPTIITQPTDDTSTVGAVDTFTITTSQAPSPLTKSVQWQFTADTTTADVASITGWTNVSSGTGSTTDTFTTAALTKAMNKYRYRAIVTFSDTSTISSIETSSVVTLTVNDSITITSDTSTITRKYGDAQSVRTIVYSGGTTNTGAVGTSTSHTVRGQVGNLASGRIVLDTSTSTVVFRVDTLTVVGTYVETITVTDFKGATTTYAQRVVVNPADTLTVQADTLTAMTYSPSGLVISPTTTLTGLVSGDTRDSITFTYSSKNVTCANGGTCAVGNTGPGGGTVFYAVNGKYLEAAPAAWFGTATDTRTVWGCSGSTYSIAYATAIGTGKANTDQIVSNCGDPTSNVAAKIARAYTGGGKSDWSLPSRDELIELCKYARTQTTGNISTSCTTAGTLNAGVLKGFGNADGDSQYWSSSDASTNNAYTVWLSGSMSGGFGGKTVNRYIRPVRYFTSDLYAANSCAAGGACAVGDIGPAGGVVFYVSNSGSINSASDISEGGTYLEAAPSPFSATTYKWCEGPSNPYTTLLGASGTAIGTGAANTATALTSCTGGAIYQAANLTSGGYSDWFLPSSNELSQMYIWRNSIGLSSSALYWGSTENANWIAASLVMSNGGIGSQNKGQATPYWPIRAFSQLLPTLQSYGPTTTPPTNAGTYTVTPSNLTLTSGISTSNYTYINYLLSDFTINKARQDTLTITSKLAPYNGGTSTMKLTTAGGSDTGTVTYTIVSGGTATGCSISSNVLSYRSAGTCRLTATKATTLNYLISYSETVTITLSAFVSNQQTQTQLYPTMLPINGANSLETTTVTVPVVTSVTSTGAGSYTIVGTGFTGASSVLIGGTPVTIASSDSTTINITGAAGLTGPLFIECSDGRMGPVPFWLIL